MDFTIIIGNRNYSSWSLRAWLAARFSGVAFKTHRVVLDTPEFYAEISQLSPSSLVPALRDGDWVISDSLAICEYLHDLCPEAKLWPQDQRLRAEARSMSCEMHSGFAHLRSEMPMNIRALERHITLSDSAQRDVQRVIELWRSRLEIAPAERGGDWLFGQFSICDAMYVPVAFRFRTYGIELPEVCQKYVEHICNDPYVKEWTDLAVAETEVNTREEVGD